MQPRIDTEPSESILKDQTVQDTVAKDPLAQFVLHYWKQILVVLGGGVAAFLMANWFRDAHETSMRRSAAVYSTVHKTYSELLTTTQNIERTTKEKDGEEKTKKLENLSKQKESLSAKLDNALISLSDEREPYKSLVPLYRALSARVSGDAKAGDAKSIREILGDTDFESSAVGSPARFYKELRVLTLARVLLDEEGNYSQGRALLAALAAKGSFVHTAAALALSRFSVTEEEKNEADKALNSVREAHPEDREIIDEELAK